MLRALIIFVVLTGAGISAATLKSRILPLTLETFQLDGRIVGGHEVSILKHPHMASLRLRTCEACAYSHHCGASIYNERVLITATHCTRNRKAADFNVVVGTNNRNGADGVISRVDKIVEHEAYNSTITDNDVAVLFLSTPLPLNGVSIKAIPLASENPQSGARAIVSGWGRISSGGMSANKLQEVPVQIVDAQECEDAYGEGRITQSMICAGQNIGGKDSCQGDSGGPLVHNGELVGIVSWGRGCAVPGFPGVYANVAHLREWIEATINGNL